MPVFSRLAVAAQLFSIIFTPVLSAATTQQYDYVIVGGGVTGLIVANRLTEDKTKTVLVIEGGDNVDTDGTKIPYKANDLTSAVGLLWDGINSTPEPALGNSSYSVLVAKVLGEYGTCSYSAWLLIEFKVAVLSSTAWSTTEVQQRTMMPGSRSVRPSYILCQIC